MTNDKIKQLEAELETAQLNATAAAREANRRQEEWRKSKSKKRAAAYIAASEAFEIALDRCDELHNAIDRECTAARIEAGKAAAAEAAAAQPALL